MKIPAKFSFISHCGFGEDQQIKDEMPLISQEIKEGVTQISQEIKDWVPLVSQKINIECQGYHRK
jgi:hypothetical protein